MKFIEKLIYGGVRIYFNAPVSNAVKEQTLLLIVYLNLFYEQDGRIGYAAGNKQLIKANELI